MKMYVINAILTLTLNVTLTLTLISLTQTQLLKCSQKLADAGIYGRPFWTYSRRLRRLVIFYDAL